MRWHRGVGQIQAVPLSAISRGRHQVFGRAYQVAGRQEQHQAQPLHPVAILTGLADRSSLPTDPFPACPE
jgi:hypothetical protein